MARPLLALAAAIAIGLATLPSAYAIVPPLGQPAWTELSEEQRQILAPLAGEWNGLEPWRRKKWIGIAQRYPAMKSEEQARIQRRMVDWVKLSPDERKAVREKYKTLQKAPPEHKESLVQKWQEYKQLPDEEKQRLKEAAEAQPRPAAPKSAMARKTPTATPAAIAPVSPPPAPAQPAAAPQ